MHVRPFAVAAVVAIAVTTAFAIAQQTPPPALATFRNPNGTFHVDLPAGWRVLSPNEALTVGKHPQAPAALALSHPRMQYAVGPVDRWLAGDFTEPWLHVVEQDDEWYVEEDFAKTLADMWQTEGERRGDRHTLADVRKEPVGAQNVEAIVAVRTTVPASGRPTVQSLDVYAPCGGSQVTLAFCSAPDRFAGREPEFRRWLATLTFARVPKKPATLSDRLWTPLLTGAVVGVVFLLLYKHTRGRR